MPSAPIITDALGRQMRKLRVQLTDLCPLRCFYCMPENPTFMPQNELMQPSEIAAIVKALVPFGLSEIRLTGGEPTARPDFLEIARLLSPHATEKFGMTSNGLFPLRLLDSLAEETQLRHLNLSLDSFQEEKFKRITRFAGARRVVNAALKARDLGFQVKLNCVIFKDINADEIMDFVRFAEEESIEVRFLEYMAVGPQHASFKKHFLSAKATLEVIRAERDLVPVSLPADSTAFCYQTLGGPSGNSGTVGFIASESQPFCNTCSRLRLSAQGVLRSCLFRDEGLSLRGEDPADYEEIIRQVVAMKPRQRLTQISQPMNEIGG